MAKPVPRVGAILLLIPLVHAGGAPVASAEGDKVEVLWDKDNAWYPATVERGWYGLHKVRYDGEDQSSNEWVGPTRIRLRTE